MTTYGPQEIGAALLLYGGPLYQRSAIVRRAVDAVLAAAEARK